MINTLAYSVVQYLPAPLKQPAVLMGAFLRSLLRLARSSGIKAQLIEGTRAGAPLRVMWLGQGPYREYLMLRLFPDGFNFLESVGMTNSTLRDPCPGFAGRCDLIAVERNRLLSPLAGFRRIPLNIRMGLDLQQQHTLSANALHRRDQVRKRVAVSEVEFRDYQVQKAPEMLRRFYYELYAPHISSQFGIQNVESLAAMRAYYIQGLLRLVFQGDTLVAGILFLIVDRTLVFCKYGIRNSYNPVHRAAASIFMQIDYAKTCGYQAYDAFHARPFFEDGVFRYKRGCGLYIHAESWPVYWDEDLYMRVLCASRGVLDFLRTEPHLRLCKDGSLAACLCPAEDEDMVHAVTEQYRRCCTPGIGRYEFLVPRKPTVEEEVLIRDGCGQPAEPLIFTAYESVTESVK